MQGPALLPADPFRPGHICTWGSCTLGFRAPPEAGEGGEAASQDVGREDSSPNSPPPGLVDGGEALPLPLETPHKAQEPARSARTWGSGQAGQGHWLHGQSLRFCTSREVLVRAANEECSVPGGSAAKGFAAPGSGPPPMRSSPFCDQEAPVFCTGGLLPTIGGPEWPRSPTRAWQEFPEQAASEGLPRDRLCSWGEALLSAQRAFLARNTRTLEKGAPSAVMDRGCLETWGDEPARLLCSGLSP